MQKLLKISAAELTTLRLVCCRCGSAVELPLAEITRHNRADHCLLCNEPFFASGPDPNPAALFAAAAAELARDSKHVLVEVVVPAEE